MEAEEEGAVGLARGVVDHVHHDGVGATSPPYWEELTSAPMPGMGPRQVGR